MTTPIRRLTGLVTCVVLGLIVPGLIFPSFTTNFTIGGGRPPLPLLEMSAAALAAQLVASGLSARAFTRLTTGGPQRHAQARQLGWIVAGTLLASILVVATSKSPVFGMPSGIVVGAALLVAGVPLAAAIWFRAYVVDAAARPLWLAIAARWQMSALLSCTTIALAMHKSANPVILGRYSAAYAVVLSVVAAAAAIASLFALAPDLRRIARDTANRALQAASAAALRGYGARDRQAVCVFALLASVQIGWLVISVAAQPPKPIPYAHVLERPEFQGKSFLTTTYEAMVWYSTRGWAYMTPANPPPQGPISKRFRHFANWQDEAKYGRPDYYLCDNTRHAYVPAGTAMESEPVATMSCRQCTCRDVAAELVGRGHEIVVDGDDFSIVRFRWPAPSHASAP